ncbi:MAG: Lrp/AsnC ligand binding domain-containing protein [Lachnospiraceae bacterium]|nr:Lrp/AsnC ligand binding domain-containing protein [Lachnospiraceae bacterium]MBQ6856823.1 Lrp/AsnC ligand binding domain-containing protein [Lachnospiraceae bacterium]
MQENMNDEKVVALIEVKVTPQRGVGYDSIAERICHRKEVKSIYLMSSGTFDFTVIVEGRTLREVAQFVNEELATIKSVVSTSTHFILKKYKEQGVVLESDDEDERMLITP